MEVIVGDVSIHDRLDVTISDSPKRHVLFLFTGYVSFDINAGVDLRKAELHFDIPDSDFTPAQIMNPKGSIGVTVTPTVFTTTGERLLLAVANPRIQLRSQGPGLKMVVDLAIANGSLDQVAYQFALDTLL